MDSHRISGMGQSHNRPFRLQCAFSTSWHGGRSGGFANTDGRLHAMKLTIPDLSLVVLVGVSGSGKSTLARRLFKTTEVLSSDYCRGLVSDDENNQAATKDAFEVLHYIARKRLAAGKLTVVDATNVQS